MPKWKDLTDNSQRVRFLFMQYLNQRIKKGYHFRRTLTPKELHEELIVGLDEEKAPPVDLLFSTYDIARYDNAQKCCDRISDETVVRLRDKL